MVWCKGDCCLWACQLGIELTFYDRWRSTKKTQSLDGVYGLLWFVNPPFPTEHKEPYFVFFFLFSNGSNFQVAQHD